MGWFMVHLTIRSAISHEPLAMDTSHYKSLELFLIQHLYAELACLIELAAGVAAGDEVARLLAHRADDAGAEPRQRGRGFLARHRGQRSGQDERFSGERAALVGRLG